MRYHALSGRVGHTKPVCKDIGQGRSDHRSCTDEETLHGEAHRPLLGREIIAHESPEGLHGDVDGAIHNPQHPCSDPEGGGVGHKKECQRGKDSPDHEVGTTATEAVPCFIAQMPDDGLYDQARDGSSDP